MKAQLVGATSAQALAHEAENDVAAHRGGRSFALSGVRIACAQQIGADDGQSEAAMQAKVALDAQLVAHAFVWVARLPQHTCCALQRVVVPRGPHVAPVIGGADVSGAVSPGASAAPSYGGSLTLPSLAPSSGGGPSTPFASVGPTVSSPSGGLASPGEVSSSPGGEAPESSGSVRDVSSPGPVSPHGPAHSR
jgi:hypothetical protein